MNIYGRTYARGLAAYPDSPAIHIDDMFLSYRALEYWVSGCRLAFRELGLRAGDAVALLAKRSLLTYASILACAAEGLTWVPLHPRFPDARNRSMLSASRARVLVISDENAEQVGNVIAGTHVQRIVAQSTTIPNAYLVRPLMKTLTISDIDAELPAYLLFTSGTTGEPKGIPVSGGNLDTYLQNFHALFPLPVRLRYTQMFDLTFDLSIHDMFVCWLRGGCLMVPTEEDLLLPVQFVRKHQIQVWFSVPTMASIAKQSGMLRPGVLPSLQYSFFCGEALPAGSVDAWLGAAPETRVVNLYGPTETTIAISAFEVSRHRDDWRMPGAVPIGKPYPGQKARVVREDGTEADTGEIGELWLAGSQVARGYLGDLTKTFAAFVAYRLPNCDETRWYRTGDRVYLDAASVLHYVGRMDSQLKINGYRVELLELEHHLRQVAGTELVAIVAVSRNDDGHCSGVVGFVAETANSEEGILIELETLLPSYMMPRRIIKLAALPMNSNGKVNRRELQELASERFLLS